MADTKKFIITILILSVFAGCRNDETEIFDKNEFDRLKIEHTQLSTQYEEAQSQIRLLQQELQTVTAVREDFNSADIYDIHKIKVTRYTNLFDENKDGKKEMLYVYFQPVDAYGDVLKASGAVNVQLWNLNESENQALLASWDITPKQLKELWYASLIMSNYRLKFDVANIVPQFDYPLTVKVTFIDYLSGKAFTEQKVIKP